jgi:hypothetical protein
MPVEDRPIFNESATAYWGVGTYFGSARSQNAQGHLLGHVYDLGKGLSATNPNLRSYATAERQNFHIDRCDVVALLCLRRAKSGGLSTIVSSMLVHDVLAERRPDLLDRLYRPFPIDRRGEVPEKLATATRFGMVAPPCPAVMKLCRRSLRFAADSSVPRKRISVFRRLPRPTSQLFS